VASSSAAVVHRDEAAELALSKAAIELSRSCKATASKGHPVSGALLERCNGLLAAFEPRPATEGFTPTVDAPFFADSPRGDCSMSIPFTSAGRPFPAVLAWQLPPFQSVQRLELARCSQPTPDTGLSTVEPAAKRVAAASRSETGGAPHEEVTAAGIVKRKTLPSAARELMSQWLIDNFENPYPSDEVRKYFSDLAGASDVKIQTFFTNARARVWKPFVEGLGDYSIETDASGRLYARKA